MVMQPTEKPQEVRAAESRPRAGDKDLLRETIREQADKRADEIGHRPPFGTATPASGRHYQPGQDVGADASR